METTEHEHVKISLTKYHELWDTIDEHEKHIKDLHKALTEKNKVYELVYFNYFKNRYALKESKDIFIKKSESDAQIKEIQNKLDLIPKWIRLLFYKE